MNITLEKLDYKEAARYLGYGNHELDEASKKLMEACEKELMKKARPKSLYRVFGIQNVEEGILVEGTNLVLTGDSIRQHLKGCRKAALMAATLSDEADRLIRTFQVTDLAKAVIMDSMASVAVEQICDQTEQEIRKEMKDYYQTFRFGLGYGDLPIQLQNQFVRTLNADRTIGLHVNESYMLVPTKSVTAVIGLSKEPIKGQAKGCQTCNMRERCKFKGTGGHCNG